MNIASEIISTILETLHKSHTSLHSYNANIEHQLISTSRCFDLVCVAHNVFGLPIREQKKCICLNKSSEKKDYITFFHSVHVSAIPVVEVNSIFCLICFPHVEDINFSVVFYSFLKLEPFGSFR
jgi:hypothetical protein